MTQRTLTILAVAAFLSTAALPAFALSEAEAKKLIEDAYKVQVLRIAKGEADGKAVYRMSIMTPKADYNAAMQVSVVTVDAESGQIMPIYRHRTSGFDDNSVPMMRPNRQSEEGLQSRSVWR